MNMQASELMTVIASQFPFKSSAEMKQTPLSQLLKSKTCHISTPGYICKRIFTPIYFDMGMCFYLFEQRIQNVKILYTKYMAKSEAMTSSTYSLTYSHRLFKRCFVKN